MKGAIICSILILTTLAAFHFPTALASTPSGTIEGNYALHIKNSQYSDGESIVGPVINRTIAPSKTYSFKVSTFIVSTVGTAFTISFSFANTNPYYSNSIRLYFSPGEMILNVGHISFGTGPSWKAGAWYNIEIRMTNDNGAFYVNGTQFVRFANAGLLGSTFVKMASLGPSSIAELYVDEISVLEDSSAVFSEGFETGLSKLYVARSGRATVDTEYFGQGVGFSSTAVSLIPQLCCGYSLAVPLGSNSRIDGTIQNATSLRGVPSPPECWHRKEQRQAGRR